MMPPKKNLLPHLWLEGEEGRRKEDKEMRRERERAVLSKRGKKWIPSLLLLPS